MKRGLDDCPSTLALDFTVGHGDTPYWPAGEVELVSEVNLYLYLNAAWHVGHPTTTCFPPPKASD